MRFEEISQIVKGVPSITPKNARTLYDLILREKPRKILELGVEYGTATCYMAAALQEIGVGQVVSVDLLEAKDLYRPSPEEQLARAGLGAFARIVRMQTGYTWFLHDEIARLTVDNACQPEYDLCIIDGAKNWTIDGLAFFLVDKVLKGGGLIIFDDYSWTHAAADRKREATDGITHRKLSEAERVTPHVREIFELLVKQHPNYGELTLSDSADWAMARKCERAVKTYSVRYRPRYYDAIRAFLAGAKRRLSASP
jgi:predicted O-methyltransferase YrrM